ncbi:CHASE2 domain-containing protein [Rhodobacteraceae bacterium B1Z28]|uniref:CHASE2 domain-containing protein n=1 Tax=Ruegeria haliotis TaxID=2747601 RepID=A0ABX2PTM3_9RHOB|nr:CHASE2 domain-containing protein [Ruegeria haliotis]NVO56902.1 CHASE2 domain-containing protein [Ruegeria haliotis]
MPIWQRWILVGAITLIVGTTLIELRQKGLLEPLELVHYDWTTTITADPEPIEDVVLVTVSDEDLGEWGWPVPDSHLSQIIRNLLAAGATTVGVDIYRDVPAGAGLEDLLEVLNDPRVVVISKLPDHRGVQIDAPAGTRSGFSDIPIDPDGVGRRALLLVNTQDGISLSLPLQLAATHTGQPALKTNPDNPRILMLGDNVVKPLAKGSNLFRNVDTAGYQIIIEYKNKLPIAHSVPAAGVLAGKGLEQFEGKAVVIGITSHSVKDYFSTPLNRSTGASFTFGAEIHAAILQQLIDYFNGQLSPLASMNGLFSSLIILVSACTGACVSVFVRGAGNAVLVALVGGVFLTLGLSASQQFALLAPVVPSLLAWTFGFLFGFAIISGFSRNQRRAIAQVFSSHLSEELSAEIWQQRKNLLSGGKPKSRRLFVTALLADIEGSTRIGNSMDADDFMAWVARLLDRLGEVARDHGGFVEKYTGDGILVVFGAPIPSETQDQIKEDAQSGLRCAQAMRAAVSELNVTLSDQPRYGLRIALNSGEALGGTLGVSGSMHYNVIGATINVTARLERWIKTLAPDAEGCRPVCMTMATAEIIDAEREWPVLSSFDHDDCETEIQVIEASHLA